MWEIKKNSFLYYYICFFRNQRTKPRDLCSGVKIILKGLLIIAAIWYIVTSTLYTIALMFLYDAEPYEGMAGIINIGEFFRIIIGMFGVVGLGFLVFIIAAILTIAAMQLLWESVPKISTPEFIKNGTGFFSVAYKGIKNKYCPHIRYVESKK